jgi:hypothetical protein
MNMSSAKPLGSIRALVVDDEAPARCYVTLLLRRRAVKRTLTSGGYFDARR